MESNPWTIADGSENASTSKDNTVEDTDATVKKVKKKEEKSDKKLVKEKF